MPTRSRAPRSLAVVGLLAVVVAVASAGVALGRQAPATSFAALVPAATGAVEAATAEILPRIVDYDRGPSLRNGLIAPRPSAAVAPAATPAPWIERATTDTPRPRPRTVAASLGEASGGSTPALTGRNKVWIPALGIRRSVTGFACTSNAYPGDRVYRWGCAGRNNVYLFGHAHSVFKPLHDAYVRGRLQKGMQVHYADGAGRVSTYKVSWWKVTTPDKGEFAYAAQSRPSMTLQTCVGAKSQYRLIVRLVKVG